MSTADLKLIVGGQHVSLPEISAGTTLHIHLHLPSAHSAPVRPVASAPTAARFQGRKWLGPLLAGVTLVGAYSVARTTHASIFPAASDVGAAVTGQERREAAAMRTLEQQLHQPPVVTAPSGAPPGPNDQTAPNPFGLEN